MIKIINRANEEAPEYFYIYTNRYNYNIINQFENHNIKLRKGSMISSGFMNVFTLEENQRESFKKGNIIYAPFVPQETTGLGNSSPFLFRLINRYNIEYLLEKRRYEKHKEFPSRLSSIFAFESIEDSIKKADGNGWKISNLRKYKLVNNSVFNEYIKVAKCNFNMIGFLEHNEHLMLLGNQQEFIAEEYWLSENDLQSKEVKINDDIYKKSQKCQYFPEYLIEGILEPVDFSEEEKEILKECKKI